MSCDISYFEPLPCPKCGGKPRYTVWEHRNNGSKMYQLGCCREVGFARRHTTEKAKERWNSMVLEWLQSHAEKEGE